MTILDGHDQINKKFVFISQGYNLHFWGNSSIMIIIKDRFQFRFTKTQTDILEKCSGNNTVEEVINSIISNYKGTDDQIIYAKQNIKIFILNMIRKGILSVSDYPYKYLNIKNSTFSGIRGKYYPYDISIELTSRCNFNCQFCYKRSTTKGTDLNFELINNIYYKLAGRTKEIRFMGGEPTINKNFEEIIEKYSSSFLISVVTNGSMLYKLKRSTIEKIDAIQFSLYGYSASSYINNTGTNTWNNLKKSIQLANNVGIESKGCVTLSHNAIENFEKYIIAAIELGLKSISFGIPSPSGRAQDNFSEKNRFSKEDKKYIYKLMRDMKVKYHDKINIIAWQHGSLPDKSNKAAFNECEECLDCGAGWFSLVISEKGRIRPCELLDDNIFDFGNIDSIDKLIDGYFFDSELYNAIPKFENQIQKHNINLSDICPTLERFKWTKISK